MNDQNNTSIAIFAGGCFWCTEAVFLTLEGVSKVVPGYIGGKTLHPTYKEICTGETGHAEAIAISFDPNAIGFEKLLEIFFATHDPTTINRQGNDVGTQYRSEVFYLDDNQKKITEEYIVLLNQEGTFEKRIVTKISPATVFYEAEDYHHNYFNRNPEQGYCNFAIPPKLEKLKQKFADQLKK